MNCLFPFEIVQTYLAGVGIHEGAELVPEGGHVRNSGLKVKVKSINNGVSEGAESRTVRVGTEGLPDQLGTSGSGICRSESSFGVGSTADGKEDGLASCLACLDVGAIRKTSLVSFGSSLTIGEGNSPDLRTIQKRSAVKSSAVVANVSKVDLRHATRSVDDSDKGQLQNIDVCVLAVVCQVLLFKVAAGLVV